MLKWIKKQCKHDVIAGKDINKYNESINNFIRDKKIVNICEFTANVDVPDKEGNIKPEKWFFAGITYKE